MRCLQDTLFDGALRLRQPITGHKAGTDGVLLAAMTPPEALNIIDLGASTGIVGLRAAQLNPDARVVLVENEARLTPLARANIVDNGLEGRVALCEADVFTLGKTAGMREIFDAVLTNPPYFEAGHVRASPDALRGGRMSSPRDPPGWKGGFARRQLSPRRAARAPSSTMCRVWGHCCPASCVGLVM